MTTRIVIKRGSIPAQTGHDGPRLPTLKTHRLQLLLTTLICLASYHAAVLSNRLPLIDIVQLCGVTCIIGVLVNEWIQRKDKRLSSKNIVQLTALALLFGPILLADRLHIGVKVVYLFATAAGFIHLMFFAMSTIEKAGKWDRLARILCLLMGSSTLIWMTILLIRGLIGVDY